jgi:glucokinase
VNYDASKKIAIGISQLGASKAIALGAYAFALNMIDKQ